MTTRAYTSATEVISNATCTREKRLDLIAFSCFILLEIILNIVIVIATWVNRKKLRHNYVYAHVTSMVMANVVLGITLFYTMLNYLLMFERPYPFTGDDRYDANNKSQNSIMTWWSLRKTFTMGLFLTFSGNVAALIKGISTSTYFVGRMGGSTGTKSITEGIMTRRRKVYLSIAVTWLLPIMYCIPSLSGWNCLEYCSCLPGYYADYYCISVRYPELCSNLWYPMTKCHLLIAGLVWLILLIIIIILLVMTVKKYYRTAQVSQPSITTDKECEMSEDGNVAQDEKYEAEVTQVKTRKRLPLHTSIKLLIFLAVSYTLCTAPVMFYLMLDPISNIGTAKVASLVATLASVLVVVYSFICPILLIMYMPRLRTAVISILLPCDCTSVTTVNRVRSFPTS
uniref:uncharacterized protein LOC104266392 isoform X2 n=1 Tax=Ciona intestinalis TaxID=7719 RepID=UPI00089DBC1D|nr:uncharacterized protein LOC104266392 isoform X2 [Ciona intestinalis]|eukprot:XP_026693529.1 uncharacterized protein LOC104266392 isoform X2 [Ciona intestinalis]